MRFQHFFKQNFHQQFGKNHKNTNTKKYFGKNNYHLSLINADTCINLCLKKKMTLNQNEEYY